MTLWWRSCSNLQCGPLNAGVKSGRGARLRPAGAELQALCGGDAAAPSMRLAFHTHGQQGEGGSAVEHACRKASAVASSPSVAMRRCTICGRVLCLRLIDAWRWFSTGSAGLKSEGGAAGLKS